MGDEQGWSWPETSCWLAGGVLGIPDNRRAVLADLLALAQDGFLTVTATPGGYDLRRTAKVPKEMPAERAMVLVDLVDQDGTSLPRPVEAGYPDRPVGRRISLTKLRASHRNSLVHYGYIRRLGRWPTVGAAAIAALAVAAMVSGRWDIAGLLASGSTGLLITAGYWNSRQGEAFRRRFRDLPARVRSAAGDEPAVPWARLVMDDREFDEWYAAHLAASGPPAWWRWDPAVTEPAGLLSHRGLHGLFSAVVAQIGVGGGGAATPAPASAPPSDADGPTVPDLIGGIALTAERFHRADAAAGGDAAQLGLHTAVRAHQLMRDGHVGEAADTSAQAIAVLVGQIEHAERIQPALVLALDVAAVAALHDKRYADAERWLRQAITILEQLVARDQAYGDDLAAHEALLTDDSLPSIAPVNTSTLDADLAAAVRLGREGRLAEALPALARMRDMFGVVAEPLLAGGAPSLWERGLLRRCGYAHWRYAIVAHALGRLNDAISAGEAAAACYRRALEPAPAGSAERDETAAQLMTTLTDTAEAVVATGDRVRQFTILEDVIALGRGSHHPQVRRALGTALHNKAVALANAMVVIEQAGSAVTQIRNDLPGVVNEAVEIRRGLTDLDGLAVWELSNSLLLRVRVAMLFGQSALAVADLCFVGGLVARLTGDGVAGLAEQVEDLGRALAEAAPDEVTKARGSGAWPLP